ncbi:hypothetical protein IQ251_01365 [Saccharopolyspora sp. HNM0983]|uniref:DUF3618 domain-containing protein n=1 Tax=Saccharopolyspora montiporae TaxID=2781240 RepID=A0A929FYV0_9PSEU|nr:hypothetical protein [Saccharopolyspora sp. HNM0983]MBE9373087.1 hypothetical protein [Saccharopolyspora sp. HNM0983]
MSRTHQQPSGRMPRGNPSAELRAEHEFAKQELAETLQELRQRTNVPERSKQVVHRYFDHGHRAAQAGGEARRWSTGGTVGVLCAAAVAIAVISYLRSHHR